MDAATLRLPVAQSIHHVDECFLVGRKSLDGQHIVQCSAFKSNRLQTPLLSSEFRQGAVSLFTSKAQKRNAKASAFRRRNCLASAKDESKSQKTQDQSSISSQGDKEEGLLTKLSKAVSCTLAAGVLLFNTGLPAWAEDTFTLTFPGSTIEEVNTVQRTLVEAWGIVRETYVDPSFNHQDWDLTLESSLADTLSDETSEEAYSKIKSMLASLGDPFTRIITPKEYENFRINNDGALEGVGLLIASERDTGHLIVMSPLDGGPAARAGIISGDELVYIDGEPLSGMDGEMAATKLRGRAGTSVTLTLRRSVSADGVQGEPLMTEVKLKRETIALSPVYSTVLAHPALDGHEEKTGYIRLTTFSQNAAADMERAISKLEKEGVESYILDLRNNPGGLVKAGLDVAQMWLNGDDILVNTIDRDGDTQPITLVNSRALTQNPLVVLVNEGSASASEILAGALHDNGRAVLVGQQTFGKGKIQSVTELRDGSALFVTVAKYLSPAFHQIDQVGIAPDLKCLSEELELPEDPVLAPKTLQEELKNADEIGRRMLQRDSCIVAAEHELDKIVT
ncbi:carboxyl-terminal processing protease [Marchantia polymorpha subsp. ruderalis]